MFKNHRVVAAIPAGRKRYLEILVPYINANRHIIDVCHIWCNSVNPDDIDYMHSLADTDPFFQVVSALIPVNGIHSVYHFFAECIEPHTLYIRFDDDICWVAPDAVDRLLQCRLDNPAYFLVFANTVNNSICSYIHQRLGIFGVEQGQCEYDCLGPNSHANPRLAALAHTTFLNRLANNSLSSYYFDRWVAYGYERISINCFCWLGSDFAEFNGKVGEDDEAWLTQDKPRQLGRPTAICGTALVSHFAYYTQREWLEKNTELLERYGLTSMESMRRDAGP